MPPGIGHAPDATVDQPATRPRLSRARRSTMSSTSAHAAERALRNVAGPGCDDRPVVMPRSGCPAPWAVPSTAWSRSTVAVGVPNSVSPPLDARYEVPASEKTLPGGNTVGAVRIGDAVHKQASPCTPTVHALLRYLENAGVEGVPPALGVGRQASSVPWW